MHLAASGGGHLELLTWIEEQLGGYDRVWVTSPGARAAALAAAGEHVRQVPNPGRDPRKAFSNLIAAARTVIKDRPTRVITSGAGSVVAFCVFARMAGARVVFVETMARVDNASASGRVLSRIADC